MLDFEFYTNWKSEIWNDRDYVVALPPGLFEHQEVDEQDLVNTVWHGWNRLSTDSEEKRWAYFSGEQKECNKRKSHSSGAKFQGRYPLDLCVYIIMIKRWNTAWMRQWKS